MAFRELDTTDALIITGVSVAAVTGMAALGMSISNSNKIKAVSAVAQDTAQRVDILENITAANSTQKGGTLTGCEQMMAMRGWI